MVFVISTEAQRSGEISNINKLKISPLRSAALHYGRNDKRNKTKTIKKAAASIRAASGKPKLPAQKKGIHSSDAFHFFKKIFLSDQIDMPSHCFFFFINSI